MPSLLFIDHAYHQITKSTFFLQEIFKTQYEVTTFFWDPYVTQKNLFSSLKRKFYDIIVCFQILPPRQELNNALTFRRGVFFPMFDAIPSLSHPIWYEYRDFHFICFCKNLYKELSHRGFSTHYIQYFPPYCPSYQPGDTKSAFFWQRRQEITFPLLERLLSKSNINHIHWHSVPDPHQNVPGPSKNWSTKVSQSKWFSTKKDLVTTMAKSALYIAPRSQEGIGQSFLEAMSMGRCVIAPDSPTMNEYIKHGETGFLYSIKKPKPLHLTDISKVQLNTAAYMQSGYEDWEKNKKNILQWVEEPLSIDEQKLKSFFNYSCQKIFLLGIPCGTLYTQKEEWKYIWPHTKIKLCYAFKNKNRFLIRILGIPVIKIKKV